MVLSPGASRRQLGEVLSSLRASAERGVEEAARQLGCSTARIVRLESGKGVPTHADLLTLIDFYDANGHREEIMSLMADAGAHSWFDSFRDVVEGEMFADHLLRFAEIEGDAAVVKLFEADLVPGLLQTDDYVDAVCAIVFPERTQRERSRFVEFRRSRRQRVLEQGTPVELSVILSEAVLLRPIGGRQVMGRQLDALRARLEDDANVVDLRVVPLRAEAAGALGGPFSILKFADPRYQNVVYLEGREGAVYLETDGDVVRYEQLFSRLERDALSRAKSLQRIIEEIDRLAQPAQSSE